jgi:hypothetical protein
MNKVFVAAVKRNQIGVGPQDSFLVSTPPGTIPATVRPPRIPELADSAIANGTPPAPQSLELSTPQMAIAEPAATEQRPAAKSGGLFGSLFSSKDDKSADKAADNKSANPIDRMARFMGLGKDDAKAKTKTAEKTPTPKPKPAAHNTRVASHGAIRPKQDAEPARNEAAKPAAAKPAEPKAAPQTATAWPAPAAPQAPATTAMNGSARVVPSGNFDNRWSAFR